MNLIIDFGRHCHIRTRLKGEQILAVCERRDWVAQVQEGSVAVQAFCRDGRQIFLRECQEGEILGGFNLHGSAELVCNDETRVAYLSRHLFFDRAYECESIMRFLLQQYHGQSMDIERRLKTALLGSVRERIVDELAQRQRKHGKILPITQSELSMRVGASRETVSREIIKLEERGVLYRKRKRYYIVDPVNKN